MFTILIVEDSKEILDLMVLHLEDKYNLIKAEDGINAIKIAKKEKIDLLILDIMLPLVNGYECMKAIREKKNIPIDIDFKYTAQNPNVNRARVISEKIVELFREKKLDEVYIVYTRMVNSVTFDAEMVRELLLSC